jgi:voltage-gated potassium channel
MGMNFGIMAPATTTGRSYTDSPFLQTRHRDPMGFTFDFLHIFFISLWFIAPVILTLALVIFLIGRVIGRREGWSRADSTYYAFITATTVGYGDFRPKHRIGKILAIVITFTGLILTGIIVALAVNAATHAFNKSPGYQEMSEVLQEVEGVDLELMCADQQKTDSTGKQAQ